MYKSSIPKMSKMYVHVNYVLYLLTSISGDFIAKKENTLNIIVIIGLTNNLILI